MGEEGSHVLLLTITLVKWDFLSMTVLSEIANFHFFQKINFYKLILVVTYFERKNFVVGFIPMFFMFSLFNSSSSCEFRQSSFFTCQIFWKYDLLLFEYIIIHHLFKVLNCQYNHFGLYNVLFYLHRSMNI